MQLFCYYLHLYLYGYKMDWSKINRKVLIRSWVSSWESLYFYYPICKYSGHVEWSLRLYFYSNGSIHSSSRAFWHLCYFPSIHHDPSCTSSSFVKTRFLISVTERLQKQLSVSVHLQPLNDGNLTLAADHVRDGRQTLKQTRFLGGLLSIWPSSDCEDEGEKDAYETQ